MKSLLALLLLTVLLSCNRNNHSSNAEIIGEWTMSSVTEISSGQNISRPINTDGHVIIRFQPDRFITGATPVNDIMPSKYSIANNNKLSIPSINHTKINESAWGNYFLNNAFQITSYRLTQNQLQLITPAVILTFTK